jgi:hypothetical protein
MSDTLIIANSIWPNGMKVDADGHAVFYPLGTNKVKVPTSSSEWPKGNKLISSFVFQDDKLVGFVDTKALIANSSKSTTFPYEYVNISLPSIAEGEMTYNYDQCVYFILNGKVIKGDVPSDEELEIITLKYKGCKTVNDVKAVDTNYLTTDIVDGVWSEGLGDLEDGSGMFIYCYALKTFKSDLSSLTVGSGMFYGCTNLTSFSAKLPKLTDGSSMFSGCRLDTASVQNIADTINTSRGTINIGIGNSEPNTQEAAAFNTMVSKGWTVYVIVNGGGQSKWNPTSLTPIDGEEQQTPIPFWAKPVPSDEEHAQYVDEQGNFYNILGGNFIYGDNLETYGMFTSLEDAAANMRLTKIEK